MAVLSVQEIYQAALSAGFTPDQAVTWTAIAMAESRGNSGAHNPSGEDSWGLWQININPSVRTNHWGDLTDPYANARAAYEISNHGTDMRPWTTTHDSNLGTAQDYRTYLDQVEAIAGGARGDHDGVGGYDSPVEPGYDQIDPGATLAAVAIDSDNDGLIDSFERLAGTDANRADSDSDGLSDAFEALRSHTDPLSGDTDADRMGDAIEWAAGTDAGRLGGIAGVSGVGPAAQNVRQGVADTDQDGLSDQSELAGGTAVDSADTDLDGVADSLETAIGTDALSRDTDLDGLADGAEIRFGVNPLEADVGMGPPAPAPAAMPSSDDGAVRAFLSAAEAQLGDRYVFGAEVSLDDPNPSVFDCSELTQWAADQAGVTIPDGAMYQYLSLKEQGLLIPVEEAANTPGALLFHFSSEPQPGGGRPSSAHVAISQGNGMTVEAANANSGVTENSIGDRFEYAAVLPGFTAEAFTAAPSGPGVAATAGQAPSNFDVDGGAPLQAGPDTDNDGLIDAFERLAGTDANLADSDSDGLTDAFEALRSHTDPLSADTDADSVGDAIEWAAGTNAGRLAGIAGVAGLGAAAQNIRGGIVDTDRDGLSDQSELAAGTSVDSSDTDLDGLADSLETAIGTDPLSLDTDLDGLADGTEIRFGFNPLAADAAAAAGSAPLPDSELATSGLDDLSP
ncbi:MAG: C40 family peptidase [Geodermatophilaceae bacterium]|nr:C40 family peptidase [Geodermatophilaceae bacterium]